MIPFNFHHLYYFYIIAQEGSVSKAAKTLRLAQPTLSAQLKQFEFFLDRKLFEREGKHLQLTEDGRNILAYAAAIFNLGQELKDALSDTPTKGNSRVQIGTTNHMPPAFITALLDFILKRNPSTHIRVIRQTMKELLHQLESHSLDFILTDFAFSEPVGDQIEYHLKGDIPVVFCAHPKLARICKKFPADLSKLPIIMPIAHSQIFQSIQEYLAQHKIKPHIAAEVEDVEVARRMALSGKGVAILNEFTALHAPSKQKLTILDKEGSHPIRERVYLLHRKRRKAHPLTELLLRNFSLNSRFL